MPAAKMFLSSKDIAEIIGISLREAQYMLCAFELKNQAITIGRRKLVDVDVFCRHLSEKDGESFKERKQNVQAFLREKSQQERTK